MAALLHDDSGLAMGYAVVITGVLLLMVMSSVAMGHTVQQRMELQSVADNAAYAGALAQADVLSRMAVLNRALAWTYVQANRLQTDYLLMQYAKDGCVAAARAAAAAAHEGYVNEPPPGCNQLHPTNNWRFAYSRYVDSEDIFGTRRWDDNSVLSAMRNVWCYDSLGTTPPMMYVSSSEGATHAAVSTYSNGRLLHLNVLNRSLDSIANSVNDRLSRMTTAAQNIARLNAALVTLRNNMQQKVEDASRKSFYANNFLERSQFCIITKDASLYVGSCDNEELFLSRHYHDNSDAPSSPGGVLDEMWRRFDWWCPNEMAGTASLPYKGFQYQLNRILTMSCTSAYFLWGMVVGNVVSYPVGPLGPFPTGITFGTRIGGSWHANGAATHAERVWADERIGGSTTQFARKGQCEPARPILLTEKFFGKAGTIVVGVKRPVENPFVTWFGSETRQGFYGSYGATLEGRQMWAVSAARAGVNVTGNPAGRYETTWSEATEADWNLHVDDWDAVMLPLARAWYDGRDGHWVKPTGGASCEASNILSEVARKLSLTSSDSTLPQSWSGAALAEELNRHIVH